MGINSTCCLPCLLIGGPLTTAVRTVRHEYTHVLNLRNTDTPAPGTIFHFGQQAIPVIVLPLSPRQHLFRRLNRTVAALPMFGPKKKRHRSIEMRVCVCVFRVAVRLNALRKQLLIVQCVDAGSHRSRLLKERKV